MARTRRTSNLDREDVAVRSSQRAAIAHARAANDAIILDKGQAVACSNPDRTCGTRHRICMCEVSPVGPPPLHVRRERAGDEAAIARVNDSAFGQADESRIVDEVRRAGHATISLVAVVESGIVGHVLFTPVAVGPAQFTGTVMGLGPMAVSPALQRQGIGSRLVRAGLEECVRAGCGAVVVVGHPEYYPRFGFRPASSFGLRCEYPVPDDVFMAIELAPGGLAAGTGLVRYLPEFGGA